MVVVILGRGKSTKAGHSQSKRLADTAAAADIDVAEERVLVATVGSGCWTEWECGFRTPEAEVE